MTLPPVLAQQYTVESELGRGGMGVVYHAVQIALGRPVALKLLSPEAAASAVSRERFLREARLATRVRHPNVVQVLDFDTLPDGHAYIAYELVAGEDLRSILRKGPPPVHEARRIAAGVISGLEAIHAVGVLHRDVKPANVILDVRGEPHLVDLGIAREIADRKRLTHIGELVGTPSYLAPEQICGGETTPATDVYGVGGLLYALVSGRAPFAGLELVELLEAQRSRQPQHPTKVYEGADPLLSDLAMRALEKDPSARPTTGELLRALATAPSGGVPPREARPLRSTSRPSVAAQPPAARPAALVARAGLVLLAAGLTLWSVRPHGQATQPAEAPSAAGAASPSAASAGPHAPSRRPMPPAAHRGLDDALASVAASARQAHESELDDSDREAASKARQALGRALEAYRKVPPATRAGLWAWRGHRPGLAEVFRGCIAGLGGEPEVTSEGGGVGRFLAEVLNAERLNPLYWCVRGRWLLVRGQVLPGFCDLYRGLALAENLPEDAGPAAATEVTLALAESGHAFRGGTGILAVDQAQWPFWKLLHLHKALDRQAATSRDSPSPELELRLGLLLASLHRRIGRPDLAEADLARAVKRLSMVPAGPGLEVMRGALEAEQQRTARTRSSVPPSGRETPSPVPPLVWGGASREATNALHEDSQRIMGELETLTRDPSRWEAEIGSLSLPAKLHDLGGALDEVLVKGTIATPIIADLDRWLAKLEPSCAWKPCYWLARGDWHQQLRRRDEARLSYLRGIEAWRHAVAPHEMRLTATGSTPALDIGLHVLDRFLNTLLSPDEGFLLLPTLLEEAGLDPRRQSTSRNETVLLFGIFVLRDASVWDDLAWRLQPGAATNGEIGAGLVKARIRRTVLLGHTGDRALTRPAYEAALAAFARSNDRLRPEDRESLQRDLGSIGRGMPDTGRHRRRVR